MWAKLKGYPWWPAVVRTSAAAHLPQVGSNGPESDSCSDPDESEEDLDENGEKLPTYLIFFIGENTHSYLTRKKIRPFVEADFTIKKKSKTLRESIHVAKKIFTGRSTFDRKSALN